MFKNVKPTVPVQVVMIFSSIIYLVENWHGDKECYRQMKTGRDW